MSKQPKWWKDPKFYKYQHNPCCAKRIKKEWDEWGGSSLSIIHYVFKCPVCKEWVYIHQIAEHIGKRFLKHYGL